MALGYGATWKWCHLAGELLIYFLNMNISILLVIMLTILSFPVRGFELSPELKKMQRSTISASEPVMTQVNRNLSWEETLRSRFLEQYRKWRGTRYHFGGNTSAGVDCSALMQHFFRDAARLWLPRTTGEQIRRGISVSRSELRTGDLVFFYSGPQNRHVGVYIGDDEFIHASSSKGVTISTLNNRHWSSRFMAARRLTS